MLIEKKLLLCKEMWAEDFPNFILPLGSFLRKVILCKKHLKHLEMGAQQFLGQITSTLKRWNIISMHSFVVVFSPFSYLHRCGLHKAQTTFFFIQINWHFRSPHRRKALPFLSHPTYPNDSCCSFWGRNTRTCVVKAGVVTVGGHVIRNLILGFFLRQTGSCAGIYLATRITYRTNNLRQYGLWIKNRTDVRSYTDSLRLIRAGYERQTWSLQATSWLSECIGSQR